MKKIVIAIMAVIMVVGLTGGAFAYFSDTASTGTSTLTAGILDIDDTGLGAITMTQAAAAPGTKYSTNITIAMEADNTLTAARTELDWDGSNFVNGDTEWVSGTTSDILSEYADNVFVTTLSYGGEDLLDTSDALGTPAVPLVKTSIKITKDADWNGDATMDSVKLSTLLGKLVYITGAPESMVFEWSIPASVNDNAVQGDKLDLVMNCAVAQNVAQSTIVSD